MHRTDKHRYRVFYSGCSTATNACAQRQVAFSVRATLADAAQTRQEPEV